jgi:hypothetical protein
MFPLSLAAVLLLSLFLATTVQAQVPPPPDRTLRDFLGVNNVKGQFLANEIAYRHGVDERPYSPNNGYRFFVLVLTNVTPPLVVERDELEGIALVDARGQSVPARLIAVGPDRTGAIQGISPTRTAIRCASAATPLDIGLVFIVPSDFAAAGLKSGDRQLPLPQVPLASMDSKFESLGCSFTLDAGTSFGGVAAAYTS